MNGNNYGGQNFNANDFEGLPGQDGQNDQQNGYGYPQQQMQNQGFNPMGGMGMQMGAPMDQNGMMYQQQQFNQMQPGQQFNGGMYTN